MRKVGEKIIYGAGGVYEIVDIKDECVLGITRTYYVLCAVGDKPDNLLFVPMDNEKLTATMRELLSYDEVMRLIKETAATPPCELSGDSRTRAEKFRKIMEQGDRREIIALIKALYKNGEDRRSMGKKSYTADDNMMQKAQKALYSEFSAVLGISEDEVAEFIGKHC